MPEWPVSYTHLDVYKRQIDMIKFWRNRTKVTPEQEKRVWNHIDSLYSKLEEGNATEDELKQICLLYTSRCV